ncbi:potassium-transporting ATPase subunit KdpA [Desulfomicrobium salsuginis]
MTSTDFIQLGLFLGILALCCPPLGHFIYAVLEGRRTILHPAFERLEKGMYSLAGINPELNHTWQRYAACLAGFTAAGFALTFGVLMFQDVLPLNPRGLPSLSWDLAFNTAVSFVTNTNWQAYGGETTMSVFSQMVGLTYQNFVSAAVGMAACMAVIRGVARREAAGIGNFWADLVRSLLYVLLPLSFVFALVLIGQGVVQTFSAVRDVSTLEGGVQSLPLGPVASQVAIKMLGVNGGGFFNANAAHPFENPTAVSNFLQMLSVFLIPGALVFTLGKALGRPRHAWTIWLVMAALFAASVVWTGHFESLGTPTLRSLAGQDVPNMEGKEVRFGAFTSAMFAAVTTDASCGAVNSMHDSFTPLGGLATMVNMLLGEVVFGGVGSGLYGMILFILLTVFLAGLMIGRTPDYLGKRVEGREITWAVTALLMSALPLLGFAALAAVQWGPASLSNAGAHGFSELLYAYTSAAQNNGSAFAGLAANTPTFNVSLALAMILGRFGVMIPMLIVAGSLASRRTRPVTDASFPVEGPTFAVLLMAVIVVVGALTYLPALSLGPVVEHLHMLEGRLF